MLDPLVCIVLVSVDVDEFVFCAWMVGEEMSES
jgi:hypothetical protein